MVGRRVVSVKVTSRWFDLIPGLTRKYCLITITLHCKVQSVDKHWEVNLKI